MAAVAAGDLGVAAGADAAELGGLEGEVVAGAVVAELVGAEAGDVVTGGVVVGTGAGVAGWVVGETAPGVVVGGGEDVGTPLFDDDVGPDDPDVGDAVVGAAIPSTPPRLNANPFPALSTAPQNEPLGHAIEFRFPVRSSNVGIDHPDPSYIR